MAYTAASWLLPGLVLLCLLQCRSKTTADPHAPLSSTAAPLPVKNVLTGFDSVVQQLKNQNGLVTRDILSLHVIDTTYPCLPDGITHCDTTVQLNDSIFYSVISLPDQARVCSYIFVVTIDEKNKKAVAGRYLHSDCDIDFGREEYTLYHHQVYSGGRIGVFCTTIFQKKNRQPGDEEKNIDHKETSQNMLTILPSGKIKPPKSWCAD